MPLYITHADGETVLDALFGDMDPAKADPMKQQMRAAREANIAKREVFQARLDRVERRYTLVGLLLVVLCWGAFIFGAFIDQEFRIAGCVVLMAGVGIAKLFTRGAKRHLRRVRRQGWL